MLPQTPPRIAALTASLVPAQLQATPPDDGWSAYEVLAHLRACADVWGGCIATMLAQDTPTLREVDPRAWIKETCYLDQDFLPSLRAFAAQRSNLLALLQPLTSDSWSRKATVTGAGKILERTVPFYAQLMARHERAHPKQLDRIATTLRQL
jgi:hypothetical protein